MSWAGLAACCFRESITSPFVLRSYQVSNLTNKLGVLVLLKIYFALIVFRDLENLINSISRICSCRISSFESGMRYFRTCGHDNDDNGGNIVAMVRMVAIM